MARPLKTGLEYFPLNCKMNNKVEMLEAECGLEGFAVYIKLLQEIYATDNGELDMSIVFRWKTLGKKYGIAEDRLRYIVDIAVQVDLFDPEAFVTRNVLTSNGVRKRIGKVSQLRERDRFRKGKGDDTVFPELSAGKPTEKYIKKSKRKVKGNNSFVADATQADNLPQPVSFTHQMRLVVEDFSPGYYWDGADAKHAQSLEKKIRKLVEDSAGQPPSDDQTLGAFRKLLDKTRSLKDFYRFRDVKTLNQDFNKVVGAVREQQATNTDGKADEAKARMSAPAPNTGAIR